MEDLTALERRITAALARLAEGLARLDSVQVAAPHAAPEAAGGVDTVALHTEIARLDAELETERAHTAQLTERLRAIKDREARAEADQSGRIDLLTKQLDVQGLELHRLRKGTIQLRESLRALRESAADGVDAALINKAMLSELEALRAARSSETQELDEIITELVAIIGPEEA